MFGLCNLVPVGICVIFQAFTQNSTCYKDACFYRTNGNLQFFCNFMVFVTFGVEFEGHA